MTTILVWLLVLQAGDGITTKEFADQDSCERTLSRQVYVVSQSRSGYIPIGTCTQVRVFVPANQPQQIIVKPTIVIKQPKVNQ